MGRMATDDESSFMISPLHAMVEQVIVGPDIDVLNSHMNHPEISDWIRGEVVGELDGSEVLAQSYIVMMHGDHGSMIFANVQPGLYDAHIQVLPEGRGKWASLFFNACLHLLFTKTDAVEIIMRRPHRNLASLAMIRSVGGEYQFTNPSGYVFRHEQVPTDVYSLTVQRWIKRAPGLRERGAWFHSRLTESALENGGYLAISSDESNLRQVGAAMEMFMAGSPGKGLVFYNRWATASDNAPATIKCESPLTLDIGSAMLIVREKDLWVPICHSQQQQ